MKGTQTSGVKRPALYWQGAKWQLAPWIVSRLPSHSIYVEPFGGSAAVLLRKEPAPLLEVYNDLHGEVVHFFRTLRDPVLGPELVRRCRLTPHARDEQAIAWEAMQEPPVDAVERARLFWAVNRLSYGARGSVINRRNPGFCGADHFRLHANAGCADALMDVAERLRHVAIENIDALELMRRKDGPETLFYVDPPYDAAYSNAYADTVESHEELLAILKGLQGLVVLSGYRSPLYDAELSDWHVESREAWTAGRTRRTECLWLSPRTWEALQTERGALDA